MGSVFIGIAGGTGSGKSTFTNRIKAEFGDSVSVIYHDNYYKRRDGIPFEERKKINYDHPDALETTLLIEHINLLKAGKKILCPVYDYAQHNRLSEVIEVKPCKVIIIEGILVLQNEDLKKLLEIKIYVEADADERVFRRALRDIEERGRNLREFYEQYVTTVKPMHQLFVEPTKNTADLVIYSGLNDVAFDIVKTKIHSLIHEKIDER